MKYSAREMIGKISEGHRAYRIMPDPGTKVCLKTNKRFIDFIDGEIVWTDHERNIIEVVELDKKFLEMNFHVYQFVTFEEAMKQRRLHRFEIEGFVKDGIVKDWHTVGQNCVSWDAIDNGKWIVRYDKQRDKIDNQEEEEEDNANSCPIY